MFNPALYLGYFVPQSGAVTGVSTTPTQVVPADPTRVYLAMSITDGNKQYFHYDPNMLSSYGVWMSTGGSIVELFWERHGLLATLPWYAAGIAPFPSGGNTVRWVALRWQPPQGDR